MAPEPPRFTSGCRSSPAPGRWATPPTTTLVPLPSGAAPTEPTPASRGFYLTTRWDLSSKTGQPDKPCHCSRYRILIYPILFTLLYSLLEKWYLKKAKYNVALHCFCILVRFADWLVQATPYKQILLGRWNTLIWATSGWPMRTRIPWILRLVLPSAPVQPWHYRL